MKLLLLRASADYHKQATTKITIFLCFLLLGLEKRSNENTQLAPPTLAQTSGRCQQLTTTMATLRKEKGVATGKQKKSVLLVFFLSKKTRNLGFVGQHEKRIVVLASFSLSKSHFRCSPPSFFLVGKLIKSCPKRRRRGNLRNGA